MKRMGTLFSGRGGAGRGRGRGGRTSAMDNTSAISKGSLDDESRYSGSNDILEFSNAAAAASAAAAGYTATGDDSHTSNDILPSIVGPTLESLPTVLPQDEVVDSLAKGQASSSISGLPPDLQVNLHIIELIFLKGQFIICSFLFELLFPTIIGYYLWNKYLFRSIDLFSSGQATPLLPHYLQICRSVVL